MPTSKLAKSEKLEMIALVYADKCQGMDDSKIMRRLGLDLDSYNELAEEMLALKGAEAQRRQPQEVFARYEIAQRATIKDVGDLVDNLDVQKQYNAVVGALRLKAELEDRIIKTGQELGVVYRAPRQTENSGPAPLVGVNVNIAAMSDGALRTGIRTKTKELTGMREEHGEGSILGLPEPVIYSGKGAIDTEAMALDEELKNRTNTKKRKRKRTRKVQSDV